MSNSVHRFWVVILLLVLGLSWGVHFSLLKVAAQSGIAHFAIVALTTIGVVLAMTAIAALRRRWPAFSLRHLRFYFICAIIGYVLEFPLGLYVAREVPAGLLAVIASTSPVFTCVIAIACRIEPVSARRTAAVATGLMAAALVLIPGTVLPQPSLLPWVLLAFLMPLAYATYHNYVAFDWPDGMDSWQVGAGEAWAAASIVLPFYVLSGQTITLSGPLPPGLWTVPLMTGLGVIEIYLYFEIVRLAGAVYVSLASCITIVAGVLWGMLLFGESHNAWIWASIILLSLSIILAQEDNEPAA